MSGTLQYLSFCDELISLSIVSSRVSVFDVSRLKYIKPICVARALSVCIC